MSLIVKSQEIYTARLESGCPAYIIKTGGGTPNGVATSWRVYTSRMPRQVTWVGYLVRCDAAAKPPFERIGIDCTPPSDSGFTAPSGISYPLSEVRDISAGASRQLNGDNSLADTLEVAAELTAAQ